MYQEAAMKEIVARNCRLMIGVLIIATVVTACSVPYFEIGKGKVTILMAGDTSVSGSRSIIPSIPTISKYTVIFTGPVAVDPVESVSSNINHILPIGTWDILIQARNGTGAVIAEGTAEDVVITTAGTTVVNITLHAVGDGFGTIALTLTWPVPYNSVFAVDAFLNGVAVDPSNLMFDPIARTVLFSEMVPVGVYRLLFHLYRPNEATCIYEAVHVVGNLTSQAVLTLVASDFTDPPIAPSGLTVTVGADRLNLSWVDNSIIVEGYDIERSTDSVTWTPLVSSLPHSETEYEDTAVVIGNTYYYRVFAYNNIGRSPASAIASGYFTAPGELTINITLSNPIDEPITFSQGSDVIVARTDSLVLSVIQSFTSYEWVLDGVTVGTSTTLTQPCAGLTLGVHHLALFVTKNGLLYSKQFRFIVGN